MFTKVVASPLEIELQDIASEYGFAPRNQHIDGDVVQMDRINGVCLADIFTDDPEKVPEWIWEEIHRILAVLFEREGIEYIDITAYNFVLEIDTDKVWIIDFGHAYYTNSTDGVAENWFLRDVLDGEKSWNPDFA
jgi:RIO-like serine/threonine protein kinase